MFFAIALLAAVFGLAASIYAYLTPATGVDDTAGPLLTALGHAAMIAAALLFLLWRPPLRTVLSVLFALAALATALAGFLLMQPAIYVPALIALLTFVPGQMSGVSR